MMIAVLFLAGHPSVTPEDLKSIRSINSGAAPLAASDAERFAKKAQRSITILQGIYRIIKTLFLYDYCGFDSNKVTD